MTALPLVLPPKNYFKIGEVAKLLNLETYVLRYWEKEFNVIKLGKTSSRHRIYQKKDIETVVLIRQLVHIEAYTVAGAVTKIEDLINKQLFQPLKELLVCVQDKKNPELIPEPLPKSVDEIILEKIAQPIPLTLPIVAEKEQQLEEINAQLEHYTTQLQIQNRKLNELQNKYDLIEMLNAQLNDKIDKLEKIKNDNEEKLAETRQKFLSSQLSWQEKTESLNTTISNNKKQYEYLTQKLDNAEDTTIELNNKITEQDVQINAQSNYIETLQNKIQQHNEHNYPAQIEKLQNTLTHLNNEHEQLKTQITIQKKLHNNFKNNIAEQLFELNKIAQNINVKKMVNF